MTVRTCLCLLLALLLPVRAALAVGALPCHGVPVAAAAAEASNAAAERPAHAHGHHGHGAGHHVDGARHGALHDAASAAYPPVPLGADPESDEPLLASAADCLACSPACCAAALPVGQWPSAWADAPGGAPPPSRAGPIASHLGDGPEPRPRPSVV
jgi:hypothetical protein